ncbi:hypothetical protein ACTFR8_23715 [Bacillus cereus group sp. MYBK15-3]|uniref:hypothetical protein n=1 Tax=Bacillus cereus group TaxID=86661 RepID=UPI001C8C9589|nr:hypothetical protein [Bacillus cereus]MBX9158607.1 hypothetical protein [Bacillus cereus]
MLRQLREKVSTELAEVEKGVLELGDNRDTVEGRKLRGRLDGYSEISIILEKRGIKELQKQTSKWLYVSRDWERSVANVLSEDELAFFSGRKAVFVEINNMLVHNGVIG